MFARETLPGLLGFWREGWAETVVAGEDLRPPLAFGPYVAVKRRSYEELAASRHGRSWEVRGDDGAPLFWLDAADCRSSNWMASIPVTSEAKEANMEAVVFRGELFYLLTYPIVAGEALVVSFGADAAVALAEFPVTRQIRPPEPQSACPHCGQLFSPNAFPAHVPLCPRRPSTTACFECAAAFPSKECLEAHLGSAHNIFLIHLPGVLETEGLEPFTPGHNSSIDSNARRLRIAECQPAQYNKRATPESPSPPLSLRLESPLLGFVQPDIGREEALAGVSGDADAASVSW